MIQFTTTIKKFAKNGEKTGWTYIDIPLDIAEQISPGNKKSFKVKGKLDNFSIEGVSLLPMGEGNYIMALNACLRKGIKKQQGASLRVQITIDTKEKPLSADFITCLEDDPEAVNFFKSLTKSHQKYFSNWIESAKTEATKERRISQAIKALSLGYGFPEMVKMNKKEKS